MNRLDEEVAAAQQRFADDLSRAELAWQHAARKRRRDTIVMAVVLALTVGALLAPLLAAAV
jgi:hypothetical protein